MEEDTIPTEKKIKTIETKILKEVQALRGGRAYLSPLVIA